MTDPVRREALRRRAERLRATLGTAVGAVFALSCAGMFLTDMGRAPVRDGLVGGAYLVVGVSCLAWLARAARVREADADVPDADPAERERLPTRAEWTMLVLRSLGYGLALMVMAGASFDQLGVSPADALPVPSPLRPRQTVWVTCVAFLAVAQAAYYVAPRSPDDRRAKVTGQIDGAVIPWWEPYLVMGLSVLSVLMFFVA